MASTAGLPYAVLAMAAYILNTLYQMHKGRALTSGGRSISRIEHKHLYPRGIPYFCAASSPQQMLDWLGRSAYCTCGFNSDIMLHWGRGSTGTSF